MDLLRVRSDYKSENVTSPKTTNKGNLWGKTSQCYGDDLLHAFERDRKIEQLAEANSIWFESQNTYLENPSEFPPRYYLELRTGFDITIVLTVWKRWINDALE